MTHELPLVDGGSCHTERQEYWLEEQNIHNYTSHGSKQKQEEFLIVNQQNL